MDEVTESNNNFWNYDYRHYLRGLFPAEAQQIIKEKWLENGLELADVSDKHEAIIDEVYSYGIHNPMDEFDEDNFLVLKNIPAEYQQRLVNSALNEIKEDGESNYAKDVLDAVTDRQSKLKLDERFGAGHLGGVDTVMWNRTLSENGDFKRVGVIDNGVAKLEPDYENDVEAIEFARSMGAKFITQKAKLATKYFETAAQKEAFIEKYKDQIEIKPFNHSKLHGIEINLNDWTPNLQIQDMFLELSKIKNHEKYNTLLKEIVGFAEKNNLIYDYENNVGNLIRQAEERLGEFRHDYVKESVNKTLQEHGNNIEKLNEVYEDLSEKANDWSDENYFEKDLDKLQERIIDLETEPKEDNDEEPVDIELKDLTKDYINKMGVWINNDNDEGGYIIDKVRVKINDTDYIINTTQKNIEVYEYFNQSNELPFTSKQDVWENFIEPEQKKISGTQNLIQIDTPFTVTQYDEKLRKKYPELTEKQSSSVAFCAVNGHIPIEIAGDNVLIENTDKNKIMSVKKDGEIKDVVLKDNLLSVQNLNGDKFNIRLLTKDDKYGLNNCLTHDENMPLVEFYDNEHKHTDLGQFVSRYGADTLLGKDGITKEAHQGKLCLDCGVPEWTVDSEQMSKVIDWLENHPVVQDAIQQKKFNKLVKEAYNKQKPVQNIN